MDHLTPNKQLHCVDILAFKDIFEHTLSVSNTEHMEAVRTVYQHVRTMIQQGAFKYQPFIFGANVQILDQQPIGCLKILVQPADVVVHAPLSDTRHHW